MFEFFYLSEQKQTVVADILPIDNICRNIIEKQVSLHQKKKKTFHHFDHHQWLIK